MQVSLQSFFANPNPPGLPPGEVSEAALRQNLDFVLLSSLEDPSIFSPAVDGGKNSTLRPNRFTSSHGDYFARARPLGRHHLGSSWKHLGLDVDCDCLGGWFIS